MMTSHCFRFWLAALLALGLVTGACGDAGDLGDNTLVPGQTDFTNAEPESSARGFPGAYGTEGDLAGSASKEGNSTTPAAPPQGRTSEVEEADIYKVDSDRLFYLNTYRGFIIYDLKDPKSPKLISRLPVYGYPIEMFIQDGTVYALLREGRILGELIAAAAAARAWSGRVRPQIFTRRFARIISWRFPPARCG